MTETWTPAETSTPVWTPAADGDLPFTSRGTLSSDAVTVGADTLTDYLDNVPLLDAANIFTEGQRIDVTVPVTPIADVGTTKPTILHHWHDQGGPIVNLVAFTVSDGVGGVMKRAGMLSAVVDTAGTATDDWILQVVGEGGTYVVASVTSSDPGELPWISDLLAATAIVGSGGAVLVTVALSPPAVDGSATTTDLLSPNQFGEATGNIPDGWVVEASGSFTDLFTLLGVSGSDPVTVLIPGGEFVGIWRLTPDTVDEPWVPVAGVLAYMLGERIWQGAYDGTSWRTFTDPSNLIYSGNGMLEGINDVNQAIGQLEGTNDRTSVVCGGNLTTNVDISATDPTLEYGECVADGKVFLNAQTDPAENGLYYVNGSLGLFEGDEFDPPGNDYRVIFNLPGDPADGMTLAWLSDNTALYHRAGSLPQTEDPGSPGRWITIFDPTSTGGGGVALGETSTTAYRGDRGKTAYDHSQVTTGNPHGTTAADVGAATSGHNHSGVYDPAGSAATAQAAAIAASQPVDSDLTAIAALTTTSFGRSLLTQADAAATLAIIGAASAAAVPFKAQVGDWVAEPHDGIFTAVQTLNRVAYVPFLVPAGFAQTDGIAVEVTTVATSALCRLGIYLPHATTGRPGALVIDGGTVDFSSGGGAAGIRTLTITATNLTPGSLIYVAVVPQGATATARHCNSGEILRSYGTASSTVADVFRSNGGAAYYENSVSGALPANATPIFGSITGQPVVALRRSA